MHIKKHLSGGTLRTVMANEIKRVLSECARTSPDNIKERAAIALGLTPRTIRVWLGPVDKGGWNELQGVVGSMEKLLKTKSVKAKKRSKKKSSKKTTSQTQSVVA